VPSCMCALVFVVRRAVFSILCRDTSHSLVLSRLAMVSVRAHCCMSLYQCFQIDADLQWLRATHSMTLTLLANNFLWSLCPCHVVGQLNRPSTQFSESRKATYSMPNDFNLSDNTQTVVFRLQYIQP